MKMKAVVLAEMLRETLEAKINKTRREIRDNTYMPIEVERMQDIVINNHGEDKDTKIRI
jgi:hypothetical protein